MIASSPRLPVCLAALAGFVISFQTIWLLRAGMLGGVPWPLATIGVYASDIVLFVAAALGAVRVWRGGGEGKLPSPHGGGVGPSEWMSRGRPLIALALLVAAALVNVWGSADPWLSAVGWARMGAFLIAIAGFPYTTLTSRAFLVGFLVAMLVHIGLGLAQFVTLEASPSTVLGIARHAAWVRGDAVVEAMGGRWLRAYGGFPHPNVFGTALLVAMILLSVISSGARPRSLDSTRDKLRGEISNRSVERSRLRFRAIAVLEMTIVATFVFALVLTFSRAALMGLCVLLIVCAARRATRRPAMVGVVAMAAAIAVTWPFWTTRVTATGPNEARSIVERRTGIRDALALSAIPPFLGAGLHAMPQAVYRSGSTFNPGFSPYEAQPVHNVPLLAAAEIGWFGIAFFLLALTFLFPRRITWRWEWLALLPPLLLDHHLWSLPIGLALLCVLVLVHAAGDPRTG